MDDFGGFPPIFGNTHILIWSIDVFFDTGSPRGWRKLRGRLWGPAAEGSRCDLVDCFGWLVGWNFNWIGWLVGWLAGWLVGWFNWFHFISTEFQLIDWNIRSWLKLNRFVWFPYIQWDWFIAYSGSTEESKNTQTFPRYHSTRPSEWPDKLVEWSSFFPVMLLWFLANLQSDPVFFSLHLLDLCFEVQGEGVAKNLQVVWL